MDGTGAAVSGAQYDYDAYGNVITAGFDPAAADTLVLYTNQLFDPVLGQYVLRARYYDPSIGRFSSFDSYEGGVHKYLYADSNPIYYTDPTGHMSLIETVGVVGLIGAILAFEFAGARSFYHAVFTPATSTAAAEVPAAHKSLALLAADCYSPSASGAGDWMPASPDKLSSLGLSQSGFEKGSFRAHLYVSRSSNAYVLAFAGTNDLGDVYADAAQGAFGANLPTQYGYAVQLARDVNQAIGSAALTMTGHSLGGGLAAAAGLATNRATVSFNAAGISGSTISTYRANAYSATADNYFVAGELLETNFNNLPFAPVAFGNQHMLPRGQGYEWSNPLSLHKMEAVLRSLGIK